LLILISLLTSHPILWYFCGTSKPRNRHWETYSEID